ncbi:MAG: hypothetical protein HY900_32385, partial [Deltaproteobacteria bacterium]|nr:hypothetical protein [Deltaproteobacteria bacterium]
LHTILVGQPGLNALIDSPELEQLRQRISVRYHLGPLSAGETGEYIRHRVSRVASDPARAPVFPDEVIPRIYEATGGIPRLINVLCDTVLLHGYAEDRRLMESGLIETAVALVQRPSGGLPPASGAPGDGLERRLAQLEARLEAMAAPSAGAAAPSGPTDPEGRASALARREQELLGTEERLSKRASELQAWELALTRKLAVAKAQLNRRVGELEKTRADLAAGRFPRPALRVEAHDPDPRLLEWIADTLRRAGIDVETREAYEDLVDGLRREGEPGSFRVCVLGCASPQEVNQERLRELAGEFGSVALVYLDDLDLSSVRRRMLLAGASAFLEKSPRHAGPDWLESSAELLVQTITGIYRRHVKWLEEIGAVGSGAPSFASNGEVSSRSTEALSLGRDSVARP